MYWFLGERALGQINVCCVHSVICLMYVQHMFVRSPYTAKLQFKNADWHNVISYIISQRGVCFVSVQCRETSVCLSGVVYPHVFSVEVGRPSFHSKHSGQLYAWVRMCFFFKYNVRAFIWNEVLKDKQNKGVLFPVCFCFISRHPVHWAANQSCRCDRRHTHGSVVWIWCGQLSLHVHVLFPQVSSVGFLWHDLQQPYHAAFK